VIKTLTDLCTYGIHYDAQAAQEKIREKLQMLQKLQKLQKRQENLSADEYQRLFNGTMKRNCRSIPYLLPEQVFFLDAEILDVIAAQTAKTNFDPPCVSPPFPRLWLELENGDGGGFFIETGVFRAHESGEEGVSIQATCYLRCPGQHGEDPIVYPTSTSWSAVSRDGRIMEQPHKAILMNPESHWSEAEFTSSCLLHRIPLMTFSILNCKNIVTVDHKPRSSVNRKRLKKGKKPLLRFKTLQVSQTVKAPSACSSSSGEGERAQHHVRGHFRDYSKGKGMFGNPKLRGLYWVGPMIRGKAKHGIVVKNYEVVRGKETKT
jgi:hypothetical protein